MSRKNKVGNECCGANPVELSNFLSKPPESAILFSMRPSDEEERKQSGNFCKL
jgi:hypothetical protein